MVSKSSTYSMSLTLNNVSVDRLGLTVLSGVSVTVSPGEALILRGANGAGKTSLLRAIAGFADYTGEIVVRDDGEVDLDFVRQKHLHFLGHRTGVSPRLKISEQLAYWAKFFEITEDRSLLQTIGLQNEKQQISQLSAGQQRRLGIARLLMAPKAIWLMDEPSAALDQQGLELLTDLWAAHRAEGGIVIMTSHDGPVPPNAQTLLLEVPA